MHTTRAKGHSRHTVQKSKVTPFFGAVSSRQNPAAHGGTCRVDTCACGATRHTNVNGQYRERGEWVAPDRS